MRFHIVDRQGMGSEGGSRVRLGRSALALLLAFASIQAVACSADSGAPASPSGDRDAGGDAALDGTAADAADEASQDDGGDTDVEAPDSGVEDQDAAPEGGSADDAGADAPGDATGSDLDGSAGDGASDATGADSDTTSDAASEAAPDAPADAGNGPVAACPPGFDAGAGPGGCAVLTVPLSGSGQNAHYILDLAPTVDLTGATVNALVIAPQATGGVLQGIVQDGSVGSYAASYMGWRNLTGASSWTWLSWTVPASFDATAIARIGLSVESGSVSGTTTFQQPSTVVYVAAITVTLPADAAAAAVGPFSFGAASTVQTTATPKYPTGPLWLNVDDSPVGGYDGGPGSSTLGWLPQ